jgi:protein phosphatase
VKISASAITDVGRKREHNEDNYYSCPEHFLFAVADGMGGAAAGEVASALVAETIGITLPAALMSAEKPDELTDENLERLLAASIEKANFRIQEDIRRSPEKAGMGSTCVLMALREGKVHMAHVGDSRIYRLRNNVLTQLTEDHSWVNESLRNGLITAEEAVNHRFKNVITRAVGTKETVQVETQTKFSLPGDVYMMCSDGLMAGKVADSTIEEVLRKNFNDVNASARELINLANQGGGPDNITIIVIRVDETVTDPAFSPETPQVTRGSGKKAVLLALTGLLLLTAVGLVLFKILTFSPPPTPSMDEFADLTSEKNLMVSGKSIPSSSVEILVNGASATSIQTSSDGSWKAQIPLTADGQFSISARTVDASGNTSPESPVRIISRDTIPPAIESMKIHSPANNIVTGTDSLELSGSTEPNTTVQVMLDDISLKPLTVDEKGFFKGLVEIRGLGDGEHNIRIRPMDKAGNIPADFMVIPFEYDTEAPPLPDFITPSGDTVNTTSLTVRVKAREAGKVEIQLDSNPFKDAELEREDVFKMELFGLQEGREHTLRARSHDKAGNKSPGERVVTFTVYTTRPPAPKVDSPTQGGITRSPLKIMGTASPGSRITLLVDGKQAAMIPTTGEKITWEAEIQGIADGNHVLKAQSEYHGAISLFSDPITFTLDSIAPPIPVPNGGRSLLVSESPFKLSGTCEANARVFITNAAPGSKTFETQCSSSSEFQFGPVSLEEGKNKFYLRSEDMAGNSSAESIIMIVTLDTVPPAPPVLEKMKDFYLKTPVLLSGHADTDSTIIFLVKLDTGKDVRFETTVSHNGQLDPVSQNFPMGKHTLIYWAADEAGNESTRKTLPLKIIERLPATPYFPDMGKTVFLDSSGKARISGRSGPGDLISLSCGNTGSTSCQADDGGRFQLDMTLPIGQIKIEAFASLIDDPAIRSEKSTLELTVRMAESGRTSGNSADPAENSMLNGSSSWHVPRPSGEVDINSASAAEIATALDIPPAVAASIVAIRTKNGSFTGTSQTLDVPEMTNFYQSVRSYMKVSSTQKSTPSAENGQSLQNRIVRAPVINPGDSISSTIKATAGKTISSLYRFRPAGRGIYKFIFNGKGLKFEILTTNPITPEHITTVGKTGSSQMGTWDTSASSTLMPEAILIKITASTDNSGEVPFEIKTTYTSIGTGDGF